MTSSFRRIDLLTKIIAPIVTGNIMTYAGIRIGCGFIAVWSASSMAVEFWLIRRVYGIVPALGMRKDGTGMTGPTITGADSEEKEHSTGDMMISEESADQSPRKRQQCSPWLVFASFLILYRGFRTYISYDVMWAGFALASLYLTVLGFDGITVGYATTQGLSSSILGTMLAVGACLGILATFSYPFIVHKLGLPLTGVLGLGLQVSCLCLCVLSIWLPGSPFDPFLDKQDVLSDLDIWNKSACLPDLNSTDLKTTGTFDLESSRNITSTELGENGTVCSYTDSRKSAASPTISVWVMIVGIVMARFGLWTADLTIIQSFLESVRPSERGIVNGVQSSLNKLMDFLKFALVVIIPRPHQFGLLILVSFGFICTGWSLMAVYAFKVTRKKAETTVEEENSANACISSEEAIS